jgi:hypothetical protein
MYVSPNYRTKKALKEAVAQGKTVHVYSPGPFPCPQDGWICVEGPHFPEAHKWYGNVLVADGKVKEVK